MYSNFLLGNLRITPDARMRLKRIPYDLIARHAVNEHGNVTSAETSRNTKALKTVGRIMSRYAIDPTDRKQGSVIVVTRATWDETLVKLETE